MNKAILWIALSGSVCAEPPVTEPITARALLLKQQTTSLSALSQSAKATTAMPESPSRSIIAQSEILHDGIHWTLVPKGAVLFVPDRKSGNVGSRPVGSLLPWLEFLTRNPEWISTSETTLEQAAGKVPIPAAKSEFWEKQDRVIIAVNMGGPVSVTR